MSSHRSKSDTLGSSKGKGKAKAAPDSRERRSREFSEQDPRSADHDGVSFGDPWAADDAVFEIGQENYSEYAWDDDGYGDDGHYKHQQQDPTLGFPGDNDDDDHYHLQQQDQILGHDDDNGCQQPDQRMEIRDGKGKGKGVDDRRKGKDSRKGDDRKKGDDRRKGDDRKKNDKRKMETNSSHQQPFEIGYNDDDFIHLQQKHVQTDDYDDDSPLNHFDQESPSEGFWGHEVRKDNPGPYVPRPPACPMGHGRMQLDGTGTWVCAVCGGFA